MTPADSKPSRLKKLLHGPFGIVIFGWGLALVVFAVIILIIGLSFRGLGEWSFDEVARVPHDSIDAVLVETNGGATTSFGYEVFVLPHGTKPKRGGAPAASLYGAVRSDRAYGVNLRWQPNDTLTIEYLDAQNASVLKNPVTVDARTITLVLKSGVNDPSAPGGGMLYNLQGRR
jgi:hypothetical protein